MTPLGTDLGPFLRTVDGFAVDAIVAGSTIPGILDRPYRESLEITGEAPSLLVASSQIPAGTVQDSPVSIDGTTYRIVSIEPDHAGGSLLRLAVDPRPEHYLEIPGYEILAEGQLDQEFPSYPPASGPGEIHIPDFLLRVRRGQYHAHPIIQIQEIAPYLPDDAEVVRAELAYETATPSTTPPWKTYRVVRTTIPDAANWTISRPGNPWSVPGCLDPVSDFDGTQILGSGIGAQTPTVLLASGREFSLQVDLRKSTSWVLIVQDALGRSDDQSDWIKANYSASTVLRLWYRSSL